MEIGEEGKALQGTDAILQVLQAWPWWAHSVSQVSASLPVDNGPVHFLTAIILKYYILLLYPQSIPLRCASNSKFHFWFSILHGLQQSTPHPSAHSSLFKTAFLFCFSSETCCFPVLSFEPTLRKSPSWYLIQFFSHPPPSVLFCTKASGDNDWKRCMRSLCNAVHPSPAFCCWRIQVRNE